MISLQLEPSVFTTVLSEVRILITPEGVFAPAIWKKNKEKKKQRCTGILIVFFLGGCFAMNPCRRCWSFPRKILQDEPCQQRPLWRQLQSPWQSKKTEPKMKRSCELLSTFVFLDAISSGVRAWLRVNMKLKTASRCIRHYLKQLWVIYGLKSDCHRRRHIVFPAWQ